MAEHKSKVLALTTTLILSLVLFLFGLMFTLVKSAHRATLDSQKNIKLEVFFNENIQSEDELAWVNSLQSKPEILRTHIINKDQAQVDFKNLMKNEWGSLVEEASLVGQLPASLIVEFQSDISSKTRQILASEITKTAAQFAAYDGSVFQKDWAQWFTDYSAMAKNFSIVLGCVIFCILYLIISNLIRSQVFHKADEIEIRSFLGATKWQIQKPFIAKSAALGLVSTLMSFGALFYFVNLMKKRFLAQSQLFSADLIVLPNLGEALVLGLLVVVIACWAARSCVNDRLPL